MVQSHVQKLEDRTLLTGNVEVTLAGRDVALYGDAADNEIAIEQMNNWVIVRGLNGTTINGMSEYLISGLPYVRDDMLIQLGDGNDVVLFADGIQVGDDLRIDTGNGNDVVRLSNNRILDDLIIDTGAGDDTVIVMNTDVVDDWGIFAGTGNNTVSVVDTRAADDFVLHTSNGNDTVTLLNATSGDRNEVHTFGGDNMTEILPVNDGRMLPGMDVLNQFISPDAVDDVYDGIEGQIVRQASEGLAINDFRAGIGGTTTFTLETDGTHGNATVNADGSFSYEFDQGFAGTDSFTYRLTNSFGGFDIATVTVTTLEIPLSVDDSQNQLVDSNGTSILSHSEENTPNGEFVLHGTTTAGATVEVDLNGAGTFDAASTVAGDDGSFMVVVNLVHDDSNNGANVLQVRSTLENSGRTETSEEIHVHYAKGTVVRFDTPLGSFDVELFDDPNDAGRPQDTIDNFMTYLEEEAGTIVHNVIAGKAVQGGTYFANPLSQTHISPNPTGEPVTNEFDSQRPNDRGTLSILLPDGDADGGMTGWSINLADNDDFNDALMTVIGRVIGTGMEDVVDKIDDPMDDDTGFEKFNLSGLVPDENLPNVPLADSYEQFQRALDGHVTIDAATDRLIGDSTFFTTDLRPTVDGQAGSLVRIGEDVYVIGEIIDDTTATLLDPDTLDPVDFTENVGITPLEYNTAPDLDEFFTFNFIKDLFKPVALDDTYEAFSGEIEVSEEDGLLSNDLLAPGAADSTVTIISDPSGGGEVELIADSDGLFRGAFKYTPDASFEGVDTFEYLVTNVFGETSIGMVEIVVLDFTMTATVDTSTSGDDIIVTNDADDTFITKLDTVTLTGTTNANSTIDIDADGDGLFNDGTVVADAMGNYSIDVGLTHTGSNNGANRFIVRSTLDGTNYQISTTVNVHRAVGSVMMFDTSQGDWYVELLDADAPITVDNFKSYLDDYTNLFAHRSIDNFILQAGGFTFDETLNEPAGRVDTPDDGIENEFDEDNSNVAGTLSMALRGGELDSGTSQWFFNTVNNDGSGPTRNLDGDGHTVFGRVIGAGLDVINSISSLPTHNLNGLFPELEQVINNVTVPERALSQVPLADYTPFTMEISGTVSVTANSNVVTGVGTSFTTELLASDGFGGAGSAIMIGNEVFYVDEIISDTQLTLANATSPSLSPNHQAGAQNVSAFINAVPDQDEFVIFESIEEILLNI